MDSPSCYGYKTSLSLFFHILRIDFEKHFTGKFCDYFEVIDDEADCLHLAQRQYYIENIENNAPVSTSVTFGCLSK